MFVFLVAAIVAVLIVIRLLVVSKERIRFFMTGLDNGFGFGEIRLLWKLARSADIDEPESLFFSVPALTSAISQFVHDAKSSGRENSDKTQRFISRLYDYRTKIDLEHDNKKGIESTKFLDNGQRLRIVLKGKGLFSSEILSNGHEIIARIPIQKGKLPFDGKEWTNHTVSVYLWRHGDAGYVFDTRVTGSGVFNGQNAIYLAHTSRLERMQKRKSVRVACSIYAMLYFLDDFQTDLDSVEVGEGYRCLIEDISEDGAMIRIGGMGRQNVRIKLQFEIDGNLVVMSGIIRAVEYNKKMNQSRIHFECLHIGCEMRNSILNFVYKDLSDEKKQAIDAMKLAEQDELVSSEKHSGAADMPEAVSAGQDGPGAGDSDTAQVPSGIEDVPSDGEEDF